MERPRIGMPLSLDAAGGIRPGRRYHYLDEAYARAVAEAGGRPVYLPIQPDPESALEAIDGLLLPGGDDFPPAQPYAASVRFQLAPEEQRQFDASLLAAARRRGLPRLGICYGMQLMAQTAGGALHHHLPVDFPGASEHRLAEGGGRHVVLLEPASVLATCLGAGPIRVNSLHHQAVARVGRRQRVTARGEDGVIEALEEEGGRFAVGVQWHPEKLPHDEHAALFRAFIEACSRGD